MPYTGPGDDTLPDNVKEMPEDKRAQFVEVFNSVYSKCIEDGGEADACETSAFKQANGVMKEDKVAPASVEFEVKLNKQSLIDQFVEAFGEAVEFVRAAFESRKIKDVDSWDGAAGNYADTAAYCKASLINVNSAAGKTSPDEWAQDHCMLPVRGPGDGSDTYVRQAVYAAAAGRGLGRVKRPDDVPEADWDKAVKAAANKIIAAYGEMDETAPASVYEAAGRTPPEGSERSVSIQTLYSTVMSGLEKANLYPMEIYHDGDAMFAIGTRDGKLFKVPFTVLGDGTVELGSEQQVMADFPAVPERTLSITRQADGRARLTGIACTAILNRSGEIDTRKLFDAFVSGFVAGEPAEVDLLHLDGSDVGKVDFLARDGYGLVYSALLDEGALGEAVARGLEADLPYWGNSILYKPTGKELVEVAGVQIPAYVDGVLRKITILPEREAAALFTTMEVERMNEQIKNALRKLVGDELADEMEKRVDGVNRRVEDEALVARDAPQDTASGDASPIGDKPEPPPAPTETDAIVEMRAGMAAMANKLDLAVETIRVLAEASEKRLGALERTDDERKRAWLNDLPARKIAPAAPIWRPRESAPASEEPLPASALAEQIMKAKKGGK